MNADRQICLHATTVSLNGEAILIRGASGSGKSSLALQLLESCGTGLQQTVQMAALVADDQTVLKERAGRLFATAPENLAGLLEVRGVGILRLHRVQDVILRLVVDLKPVDLIARLPEPHHMQTQILGVTLPCVAIDANLPSAASRVRVALAHLAQQNP